MYLQGKKNASIMTIVSMNKAVLEIVSHASQWVWCHPDRWLVGKTHRLWMNKGQRATVGWEIDQCYRVASLYAIIVWTYNGSNLTDKTSQVLFELRRGTENANILESQNAYVSLKLRRPRSVAPLCIVKSTGHEVDFAFGMKSSAEHRRNVIVKHSYMVQSKLAKLGGSTQRLTYWIDDSFGAPFMLTPQGSIHEVDYKDQDGVSVNVLDVSCAQEVGHGLVYGVMLNCLPRPGKADLLGDGVWKAIIGFVKEMCMLDGVRYNVSKHWRDVVLWIATRVHTYRDDVNSDDARTSFGSQCGDCEDLMLALFQSFHMILAESSDDEDVVELRKEVSKYRLGLVYAEVRGARIGRSHDTDSDHFYPAALRMEGNGDDRDDAREFGKSEVRNGFKTVNLEATGITLLLDPKLKGMGSSMKKGSVPRVLKNVLRMPKTILNYYCSIKQLFALDSCGRYYEYLLTGSGHAANVGVSGADLDQGHYLMHKMEAESTHSQAEFEARFKFPWGAATISELGLVDHAVDKELEWDCFAGLRMHNGKEFPVPTSEVQWWGWATRMDLQETRKEWEECVRKYGNRIVVREQRAIFKELTAYLILVLKEALGQ